MIDPDGRSAAAKWTAVAIAGVSVVVLVMTAVAAMKPPSSPAVAATSTTAADQGEEIGGAVVPTATATEPGRVSNGAPALPTRMRTGSSLTAADGYIPDDAPLSPFDTAVPAIANLDPALRDAILSAAGDASAVGVEIFINSGWRSERYQQALLDEAIVTYGSEEEARKWVKTPDASTHVTGEAIDVGPTDAASWLSQFGSGYGLCQAYANELWHFELLVEPGGVCPAPIIDASAG